MLFSSRKPRQKQSHSKFKRKLPQGSFSLNWGNRAHRPPVPLPIVGVEVIGYSFTLSMPLRTQEKPPKLRPDLRSRPFFLTFPRTKKGSVAFFCSITRISSWYLANNRIQSLFRTNPSL